MNYRSDIDGLRTLAVLPVMLFHAGLPQMPGGFVGVDIFFVISGYLITRILVHDLDEGQFSLLRFYERRARRILPALFLVMIACLVASSLLMLPEERQDFAWSIWATLSFTSNHYFWETSGYFAAEAELKPLLHTWSLAVEEQFYIIFPLLLFGLFWWRRQSIGPVIAILALISLALAEFGSRYAPDASYYLLPTRAWELAIGALVAIIHAHGRHGLPGRAHAMLAPETAGRPWRQWATGIGLALILLSFVLIDKTLPFPGIYALPPVVGTALIIACGGGGNRVSAFLGWRPLVGLGLVSYSAYLWHQSVFAFWRMARFGEESTVELLALIPVVILLAYLSWAWVEQPFRQKDRYSRRAIFARAGVGGAVIAAVALLVATQNLPGQSPGPVAARERSESSCHWLRFLESGECPLMSAGEEDRPLLVLWGDSYADSFLPSMAEAARADGRFQLLPIVSHSCPALLNTTRNEAYRQGQNFAGRCRRFQDRVQALLTEIRPDAVILGNALLSYAEGLNPYDGRPILLHDHAGKAAGAGDLDGGEIVARSLVETVTFLDGIGSSAIVLMPYPQADGFEHRLRRIMISGMTNRAAELDPQPAEIFGAELREIVADAGLAMGEISPAKHFCQTASGQRACSMLDAQERLLFFDRSHFSAVMAPLVAQEAMQLLPPQRAARVEQGQR